MGYGGDHIALLGASNLYKIGIWIVSSIPDSEPVIITPAQGNSIQDIYLGHISETHYVTLQPAIEDGQNVEEAEITTDTLCHTCGYYGPHECLGESLTVPMGQPHPPGIVNWCGCVFPDDSSHCQISLCERCGQQNEQCAQPNKYSVIMRRNFDIHIFISHNIF